MWENCFITGTWGPNKNRKLSGNFSSKFYTFKYSDVSLNMSQNVRARCLVSVWQASWMCLVNVLCRSSFNVSMTMCWSNKMASVNYYWCGSKNVSWISFFSFTRAYVTVLKNSFLPGAWGSNNNGKCFWNVWKSWVSNICVKFPDVNQNVSWISFFSIPRACVTVLKNSFPLGASGSNTNRGNVFEIS